MDLEEEREYPREPEDTRPVDRRPFVGRWPNPLWVGLEDDAEEITSGSEQ